MLASCALMPLRIGKRVRPRNSGWCNLYFIIGDLMISLFTVLGDGLRPKSFPSLFGAATSVAFGTFGLTIPTDEKSYAAMVVAPLPSRLR